MTDDGGGRDDRGDRSDGDGDDRNYREAAIAALADRAYERAGDLYTRAAWDHLAAPREGQGPFEADERGWVGTGLQQLCTAAVAYRVAGAPSRATYRGVEGTAVARDLRTALATPVQRACLGEFVADCQAAGGIDGADDAYREAIADYEALDGDGGGGDGSGATAGSDGEAVGDPRRWATSPLFEAAAGTIQQVARGLADGEIAVTWEDLHGDDPDRPGDFLARRARYKRRRFPTLIQRAVEAGHLAAPRGTTAYGEDAFRCPNCGASDVNWTGDSELCLRCSTPLER